MLSSVTVAAFLVFGYPHYSPYLAPFFKKLLPSPEESKTSSETPVITKTEPTLNLQKPTYKTASQIPTLPLQEEDADTAPVEEEATITQPLKERPFSPQVTEVTIPSGRIISTTQFDLDDWTLAEIQHLKDKPHYCQKDTANKNIYAVCQYNADSGNIEGLVMRTHPDGGMSFLANFKDSKRSGPLHHWNKYGQMIYYSEWVNGNKQGISCLFEEEKPVLVQEWKADKILCQYKISYANNTIPKIQKVASNSKDTKKYIDKINKLEQELDCADDSLRKNFSHDFREISKEIRLKRAAELAPQKRELALQREKTRQLQNQAAEAAFWKHATTGYKWDTRRPYRHPRAHPIEAKIIPLK